MTDALSLRKTPEGILVNIVVQPKSSRNGFAGLYKDALKIKIMAPPVDGAANKMCAKFLAKSLNVPKTSIEILSGETGRNKTIRVRPKPGKDFAAECARISRMIHSFL
jgi:uncharacterized protein